MIELTDEQRSATMAQPDEPIRLVDPVTRQALVLLRAEEYDRLRKGEYDDGPWTDEEMDLLAAEDADSLGWEGMDAYQDAEP